MVPNDIDIRLAIHCPQMACVGSAWDPWVHWTFKWVPYIRNKNGHIGILPNPDKFDKWWTEQEPTRFVYPKCPVYGFQPVLPVLHRYCADPYGLENTEKDLRALYDDAHAGIIQYLCRALKFIWPHVLELMQMHPKERLCWVILTASWFNAINVGWDTNSSIDHTIPAPWTLILAATIAFVVVMSVVP